MADDFSDPFRYGLNNLPAEPPDSFSDLYPQGQLPSTVAPPLGAPQVVEAPVSTSTARLDRRDDAFRHPSAVSNSGNSGLVVDSSNGASQELASSIASTCAS